MNGPLATTKRVASVAAALTAALLVIMSIPVESASMQTPSIGGGDCWQAGTPFTCRTSFPASRPWMYFRAVDHFSTSIGSWGPPANGAVNAWNGAPGPQYYSFSARSNDTIINLNFGCDGCAPQHGRNDLNGKAGLTWNCNSAGYCADTDVAMNIYYSDVYINGTYMATAPDTSVQNVFAHESGHAMGLAHNFYDSSALMYPIQRGNPPPQGPKSNDLGSYPGCAGGGLGIFCIYAWGR